MAGDTDFDPVSDDAITIGKGMFEESMGPGSALAHLYRGEIHRMKMWRERLDRTTNWAVTIMAAVITWSFSSGDRPHYVILVGGVMIGIFLVIEARRYRGYDMWRSRVRILQENVIAHGLDPSEDVTDTEWRRRLAEDYRNPAAKIPYSEAIAHRLRRIYLPLFTVVVAAWSFRVFVMPDQAGAWPHSADVGVIPGGLVTAWVLLTFGFLSFVAMRPRKWRARGELRNDDIRDHDTDL